MAANFHSTFTLQLGGGLAGMLIVPDDALTTPAQLLFMEEIHLVLQHMSFMRLPEDHPLRFQHLGRVQVCLVLLCALVCVCVFVCLLSCCVL